MWDARRVSRLLLFVLVLLVFGRAVGFELQILDDTVNVRRNLAVAQPSLHGLYEIWTSTYAQLYIPVSYTLWQALHVLAAIFGARPEAFYHGANVVLHALNALLVFRLLDLHVFKRARNVGYAAAGAALFAFHPLQLQAVAWVTGLKDVLSACLGLLAMNFALDALASLRLGREAGSLRVELGSKGALKAYAWASLCFLLSLLAKPQLVLLPVSIAVLLRWSYRRSWVEAALPLAPWALAAVVFSLAAKGMQPDFTIPAAPAWWRPIEALDNLGFYLGKIVWPWPLTPDYSRLALARFESPSALAVAGATGAALVAAGLGRKRAPALGAAALLVIAPLLPVLGLVPFGFQQMSDVADRFAYLSLLGVAFAGALALARFPRPVLPLLAAAVLGCVVITVHELPYWHDPMALYGHALEIYPESASALDNVGAKYHEAGDLARALENFEKAFRINPYTDKSRLNYEMLLAEQGRVADLKAHYERLLDSAPLRVAAEAGYGYMLVLEGRVEEGVNWIARAAEKSSSVRNEPHEVVAQLLHYNPRPEYTQRLELATASARAVRGIDALLWLARHPQRRATR